MLVGTVDLKGFVGPASKFETIGTCKDGDAFGEEGLFEAGTALRKETAVADQDSFLLEISKPAFA